MDVQYLNNHVSVQKPPSSRGSHSSDTSSAYSGSDTMQVSLHFLEISCLFTIEIFEPKLGKFGSKLKLELEKRTICQKITFCKNTKTLLPILHYFD